MLTVIPIPGCRTVERLEENGKGAELHLPSEDVKALRKFAEDADGKVAGARYPEAALASDVMIGHCLPLSEWKE